jgi:hypothetical protein
MSDTDCGLVRILSEHQVIRGGEGYLDECSCRQWRGSRGEHANHLGEVLAGWVRQQQAGTVKTAQKVLAGEDTVEWARNAIGSSVSLPYAIELLDDLIDDLTDDGADT